MGCSTFYHYSFAFQVYSGEMESLCISTWTSGLHLPQRQELCWAVPCKIRYLQYCPKEVLDKCFVNISEHNIWN